MTDKIQKGYPRTKTVLAVVGLVSILLFVSRPTTYEVKIYSDDNWTERNPPIYLQERRWWNFVGNEYPLRYNGTSWEYNRDGEWEDLGDDIEKYVDLSYYSGEEPEGW